MAARRTYGWVLWGVGYLIVCQLQAISIVDRTLYGEWLGKSGDKFTQIVNLLQIAVSIALFLRGRRAWPSLRTGGRVAIVLSILLLCSAEWSVSSGATIRAGIQYLFLMIGAIGIAENVEADDFMDLLARIAFVAAILSLALLVVSPASAFGPAGDFRGVFSQKNPLGEAMSMGALATLHVLRSGRRGRFFPLVMFVALTAATIRSASTTSLLAIILFVVLGAALKSVLKGGRSRVLVLNGMIIAAPLALIGVYNQGTLLEILGKDPTLTGRTDIWGFVIPDIFQRPLLGWGYAAFWSTENPAAARIADALRWWVPQAHNGVLEILLSAGFVGGALFVFLLARFFKISWKCMQTQERGIGITCFSGCAGIILVGVSENVLLYTGAITFVFFVTSFSCERALWSVRRRQRLLLAESGPHGVEPRFQRRARRARAVDVA